MCRIVAVCLIFSLTLSLLTPTAPAQDTPTPAEQFKALRKEYDRVPGSGKITNDAERMVHIGKSYKHHNEMGLKFVELAQKHPDDPITLDALMQAVWQVNGNPWPIEIVGKETAITKAFEIVLRDHIKSDRLGPLCQRVSYGFHKEYETFLRTVLGKSPHQSVQAMACRSLGQFLNNRRQRLDLCKEQPEQAKIFEGLFGKEYIAELQRQDRATVEKEIEAMFVRAVEKYGDVKLPFGDTIGEVTKADLFEFRNLRVGKPAPDIDGVDQDGKQFKLSDYRGKVIFLDFWSFV